MRIIQVRHRSDSPQGRLQVAQFAGPFNSKLFLLHCRSVLFCEPPLPRQTRELPLRRPPRPVGAFSRSPPLKRAAAAENLLGGPCAARAFDRRGYKFNHKLDSLPTGGALVGRPGPQLVRARPAHARVAALHEDARRLPVKADETFLIFARPVHARPHRRGRGLLVASRGPPPYVLPAPHQPQRFQGQAPSTLGRPLTRPRVHSVDAFPHAVRGGGVRARRR
mmetsp:Transcript_5462/g.18477  ORF Transcript_5462/g.18477 Transcript_5462/m.18477 type:complete len:222 (+) Transcript_5462:427-1092(+)